MCEIFCQSVQKNLEEKQLEEEQAIKAQSWKFPVCYDDDDDEEGFNSLNDSIISELPPYSAVTPTEPVDSLSMGDEHLNTISELPMLRTLSQTQVCPRVKMSSLFLRRLILFSISSPVNSVFSNHFRRELMNLIVILRKKFRLTKRLLYDNSSPLPPEEIVSDNSNADIESFSPSPIPNEDSDSHMEEIDLFLNPDDPMSSGIEDDDYESGRDISILKELLDNYSFSFPDNESYHFDIPSPYRPPAKPPDGNTGTLNIKMMGDVSDQKDVVVVTVGDDDGGQCVPRVAVDYDDDDAAVVVVGGDVDDDGGSGELDSLAHSSL
nr:hypothetical protein [Tanacetum cinerariifolium]